MGKQGLDSRQIVTMTEDFSHVAKDGEEKEFRLVAEKEATEVYAAGATSVCILSEDIIACSVRELECVVLFQFSVDQRGRYNFVRLDEREQPTENSKLPNDTFGQVGALSASIPGERVCLVKCGEHVAA